MKCAPAKAGEEGEESETSGDYHLTSVVNI